MRLDITWTAKLHEDGSTEIKGLAADTEITIRDEWVTHGTIRADIRLHNSNSPVADCYGFRDLRYVLTAISRVGDRLRLLGYDFDFLREVNRIEDAIHRIDT